MRKNFLRRILTAGFVACAACFSCVSAMMSESVGEPESVDIPENPCVYIAPIKDHPCVVEDKKISDMTHIIVRSLYGKGLNAWGWHRFYSNPHNAGSFIHGSIDAQRVVLFGEPSSDFLKLRGWHSGRHANFKNRSANDLGPSVALCEPKSVSYSDPSTIFAEYDPSNPGNDEYFAKVWHNAVLLHAYVAQKYNVCPENIWGHCEAHTHGWASNKITPLHWFRLHNKSMDDFRGDVQVAMESYTVDLVKVENDLPEVALEKYELRVCPR